MSIDLYPYLDLKHESGAIPTGVGAASLLHCNQDEIWPEFFQRDLRNRFKGIRYANFAIDGATTHDLLKPAFAANLEAFRSGMPLITVTIGGNDILGLIFDRGITEKDLSKGMAELVDRYDAALSSLTQVLPKAQLIVTTIYDPSDGTGVLPGFAGDSSFVRFLIQVNDHIKEWGRRHGAPIADVHRHFSGHGLSLEAIDERWFWPPSPIEPSSRGASEIRRLWLDAVDAF
jgi:lysophospholipase L1-like esterase